jgi:hypothetical protein
VFGQTGFGSSSRILEAIPSHGGDACARSVGARVANPNDEDAGMLAVRQRTMDVLRELPWRRRVSIIAVLAVVLLPGGCSSEEGDSPAASSVTAGAGGFGGGGTAAGGSAGASVVPRGSRVLALEAFHDGNLDHATIVDEAMAVGVKGIPPTLPWSLLEPSAPRGGTSDYAMQWIGALNAVYAPRDLEVLLSIPTVDTVSLLLPPDLSTTIESGTQKFSDAAVIERMTSMLDALYAAADPDLRLPYVVVGNEVDIYLASKPAAFWDEYRIFIEAARSRIKMNRPDTIVGVNIAFQGIADEAQAARLQVLVTSMDAVFTSYYFHGNDFGGRQAQDVQLDVAAMVAFAGNKPLVLKEFGYATGQSGNSEAGQVEFVQQAFAAWDAHADRIPYLVYSRMYDGDLDKCEGQAESYGFGGDADFIQFLCTLGLRRFDDSAKPAWDTFVGDAAVRGF